MVSSLFEWNVFALWWNPHVMVVSWSIVVYWLDSEKSWSVFTLPEMRSLDILIGWHVLQCQENLILYVVMDMVIQEGYDRAYFYERDDWNVFSPHVCWRQTWLDTSFTKLPSRDAILSFHPTCRIVTKILHSILPFSVDISHGHFFDCRVTIRPGTSRIDQTSASWIH